MLKIIKFVIFIFIIMLLSGVFIYFYLSKDLPFIGGISQKSLAQSTKIYDRAGEIVLYEVFNTERRTFVKLNGVPDSIKWATLAAEDANFYEHPAFDIKAIVRAVFHNLINPQEPIQGGSTITQQLVKNTILSREKTFQRKIKEIILALRLERQYSKDAIFELYLNQIPYGSNAFGVEAASQTFFNKPVKDLTLAESVILAALPKAPTYYSPYGENVEALRQRANYILDRMVDLKFITKKEATDAQKQKIQFAPPSFGIKAPHFVMYIKSILEQKYGSEMVESGGLKVITTLDAELQEKAEEIIKEEAERNKKEYNAKNLSLVAENPKTGEILAMVGSVDYFDIENDGNFNAVLGIRQPGSALKPFVYLKAFEKGFRPETVVFDTPTNFSVDPSNPYTPQNYDGKFRGPISLNFALGSSLNVPSVKVLYLAGLYSVVNDLQKIGVNTLTEPDTYGLSLVLGGGAIKPLELVSAYSVLAQDGVYHQQKVILKVEDNEGKVLEEFIPEHEKEGSKIFEPRYVRMVNNILSTDIYRVHTFGLGSILNISSYKVAVKTGTSQDFKDGWAFGYTPTLAVGVWAGNNDNTPMTKAASGLIAAGLTWNKFMKFALDKLGSEEFPAPDILAPSSKPMVSGNYIVEIGGKKEIHNILYWVNKDNPLGSQPLNPADDSQFYNWELGVQNWLKSNPLF